MTNSPLSDLIHRRLGKAVSVVTDGAVAQEGCPQLGSPAGRRACAAGAARIDGPLMTFS